MFEGTIMSGLMEQEKKIDFDKLKFPIYKKRENNSEWYRFDSIDKLITARGNSWRGNMISVGIAEDVDKSVFVDLYSNCDECSDEEFNNIFKEKLDMLNSIFDSNTDSDK